MLALLGLWVRRRRARAASAAAAAAAAAAPTDAALAASPFFFDAVVVGGGPGGSYCAHRLAEALGGGDGDGDGGGGGGGGAGSSAGEDGEPRRRVAVLERAFFPRDHVCGDRIAPMAQERLREMDVLDALELHGDTHWGLSGGFVGPAGAHFLCHLTAVTGSRLLAVQRVVLDHVMANAARAAGAAVFEGATVLGAARDPRSGLWRVRVRAAARTPRGLPAAFHAWALAAASQTPAPAPAPATPPPGEGDGGAGCGGGVLSRSDDEEDGSVTVELLCRVLVEADGAEAALGRALGVVAEEPAVWAGRAFARSGTHRFPDADHVMFFSRRILPGYVVVQRLVDDWLNITAYFVPRDASAPLALADCEALFRELLERDPDLTAALGPGVELTEPRFARMRFTPVPRPYADGLVVIGAAAGLVDAVTGAGLHYALESAAIAAELLAERLRAGGDLSERALAPYADRVSAAFGRDLRYAAWMAYLIGRLPSMIDAGAEVIRRRGPDFVESWGAAAMGGRSKSWFFQPSVWFPMLLLLLWRVV